MLRRRYPSVLDPERVGKYRALAYAGGGYVWDDVLEYRVWCHPADGGDDFYRAFATAGAAAAFVRRKRGDPRLAVVEPPIALVLQRQYVDEPEPGRFVHMKRKRITEWPLEFLHRPRRTRRTLVDFFAPDAPRNRLAILRGAAPAPR